VKLPKRSVLMFLFAISLVLMKGQLMANESIENYTLNNGLTVILINDNQSSLASVRTYVKAGSIFEDISFGTGISHYLEHLVAGGTTSFRHEDDYKKKIAHLGGAYNAYTTSDHTSYYINTTNEHIPEAVQILYEWMFHNVLDDREVSREKEVITREIEKTSAHVGRQFYYLAQENFYINHPNKFPVIGYLENFLTVTPEQLKEYYSSFYVPSNMILVVGGAFDKDAIKSQIENTFGSEARKAEPVLLFNPEPKPFTSRFQAKQASIGVTHVSFRFATTDLFSTDLYPLDLLDYILGNGEESILHKRLVEEEKLAYSISTFSYTPVYTTGFFDISAEIDLKNLETFKLSLLSILKDIKSGDISKAHLERAKKQKVAEDILSVSTMDDKVSRYGQGYLFGKNTNFHKIYAKNFKTLTKKDLVTAANTYFNENILVTSVLYPDSESLMNESETTTDSLQQPATLTTLPNGIKLLLSPNSSEESVYTQIVMMSGMRYETTTTNGIGYLLADTLGRASKKYSKDKLNRLFEDQGASIHASVGNNVFYYTLECLEEDFDDLLPVFEESFLNPLFPEDVVEESKRKQIAQINKRHDDWHRSAQYQFKRDFYNSHPYCFSTKGEIESVKELNAQTLKKYFSDITNPSDMIITVHGNFDTEAVQRQLSESFSTLEPTQPISPNLESINHDHPTETSLTINQDVTALYYGFNGVTHSETDLLLKIDLLDAVLSGMRYPSGRLHNKLRDAGYVYMVYASNRPGIEKGHFQITALINSKHLDATRSLIESEIRDLQTNLISDEEFELAIDQMKYYYQDRRSNIEARALIEATDELYGRGYTYSTDLMQDIDSLQKEDVKEMANYLLTNPQVYVFTPKN